MSTVQHCDHPHIERINLGAVSAYAVAKKHGFTGTEAEWEAYIANASIKAQEAARDAASAAASAADARSSLGQIRDQNEGLFLRYDEPASLTEENKAQVRENIGLTYTETEAVSFLGEVAAVEGSVAVYADIPGYWRVSTGSLDTNNWSVHTRMISIKGFEKVFGRAWMRDYGYYVAYFDENYQLMEDISLVGGLSDAMSNFRFGNNSESEPLDLATAKAAGACYISISSAGSSTDYPYIFWGKPVSAPVQEGFDPGIHDIGRVESHGVSYADFGARLDGEHDDTDAVIACHEYANAHGCPVYQHKGTVRMKTARHRYHGARHNVQIKTDVDWTGTTFLILPEDQGTDDQGNPLDNGEQIAFSVTPEVDYEDVSLTAEQIAELHDNWLNIPFLKTSYPNEIVTFSTTDIVIGRRDGEETYTAPSYYSETVTVDRNGGLMDGHMFRDMTECEHVTMAHRSIMDHPITIKGGTFLRGTGNRFVNPYYLYITRSNVTIQGLKVDAGTRHETGDRAYRGELIRANYAYNLCFRDCVCENFSTFFPWADRYNNNVCYVLVCTHCSNVLIDHCNFLRGWGPMQTSWCKHLTVRNSTMGRVDNHYGCRDYLIEGCTMVTSHSNINVGYGDGYLTIRDCKFIKTRDYDTMMNSRIVYCREDMCAIFSGDITIENIQIESDYETTVLYAALESTWEFKAESTNQILPMKLPKVRMRNIYFRRAGWTEGHHFTLLEYGVNRSASAVLYGYIMADNAVIDGVYSDMEARVLPMLEHVTLTGDEPWIIKVRNYNCEVQVTKDINIDPDENMDFNLPLVMLLPDPDVNFQQQIDALSRQDSQESAREAKEAEIGAQESQRKAAMSQTHAHEEAVRASRSQTAAAESQTDAAASAEAAASSETNAAASETAAAESEAAAAASAAAAQAVLDSIPADYTQMTEDVSDLERLTLVIEEETDTTDILDSLTWTSGYMGINGVPVTSNTLRYSNKIQVSEGNVLSILPARADFRFVCAFSGDTAISDKGAENATNYTVPAGVDAVVVTVYNVGSSYAPSAINYTTITVEKKNIYDGDITELTERTSALEGDITRIDEDVEGLNDNVSGLQEAVEENEALTIESVERPTTTDILGSLTWTSGYMGVNGTTGTASNTQYSDKIQVSEGDVLSADHDFRFVCAFNGDVAVSDKGAQNVNTYTVPSGVDAVIVTVYAPGSAYAPSAINYTTITVEKRNIYDGDITELTGRVSALEGDITRIDEDVEELNDNVSELSTDVSAMEEAVTVEQYIDEEETNISPVFSNGYMSTSGVVNAEGSSAYFDHTQKISVQPGDVVTAWRDANSYSMRFVCAFSGNSPVPSSGSSDEVMQFTVPEGIDGVVVSVRDSTNINAIKVIHTETQKAAYVKPIPMGFLMEQGSLSSGAAMVLPFHNVKNHNIYVFNANVQAFSKIKFSKESSTYVEVDSTNLIITNDLNSFTIPHGLTIANNITLMVCNETATSVTLIRVSSNGQEFNYTTATRFIMDSGSPRIESVGSTLTECTFSWVSKNLNAPIWLFGDSYFSWYDNRWTYYLARDGYTKDCMLNGYAGEASADAYTALKNLLAVTTPKSVVWCMGMNDGDSTTAVSANWQKYYEKLINLSKEYGFEIVLYTVPTTPAINNQYKDAIIRSSGYRYIEADKAVRIDENGNWIPGALNEGTTENPDNVHPTPMGAKIIYYRVLSDLPEIMCNY